MLWGLRSAVPDNSRFRCVRERVLARCTSHMATPTSEFNCLGQSYARLKASLVGTSPRKSNDSDEKGQKGSNPIWGFTRSSRSRWVGSGGHVVQRQSILGDFPLVLNVSWSGTLHLPKRCFRRLQRFVLQRMTTCSGEGRSRYNRIQRRAW